MKTLEKNTGKVIFNVPRSTEQQRTLVKPSVHKENVVFRDDVAFRVGPKKLLEK